MKTERTALRPRAAATGSAVAAGPATLLRVAGSTSAPACDADGVCAPEFDPHAAGTGTDGNEHDIDAGTRDRVARALLLERSVTASAISHDLGLTPAAVRRHLDALVADGLAYPIDTAPTGQRGRPARSYRLTEAGRERFPQSYEDLAAQALQFLLERAGHEAVMEFARSRAVSIESRLRDAVAAGDNSDPGSDPSGPGSDRRDPRPTLEELARTLDADGYATSVRPVGAGGAQLCQHHCPVAHVAAAFPQLCEAETELFGRVLGRHVQRLATIANGDGVCTTHIPGPVPVEGPMR